MIQKRTPPFVLTGPKDMNTGTVTPEGLLGTAIPEPVAPVIDEMYAIPALFVAEPVATPGLFKSNTCYTTS